MKTTFPKSWLSQTLLCLFCCFGAVSWAESFHKGICLEGGPSLKECHTDELLEFSASHVSLNPFGFMRAPDNPALRLRTDSRGDSEARWFGESDDGLKQYAARAHSAGLSVMLRPHIWLASKSNAAGESDLWLADVEFATEEEWNIWAEDYRTFALHYARVAEEADMDWYSVGAELTRLSIAKPDYWRGLIAEIREVYSGKLLYSGNWYEEAEGIQFWDHLDAIGIQCYVPLVDEYNASEEALIEGWQEYLKACEALSKKWNKPIIFTEIGYRSTSCAAVNPWDWQGTGEVDLEFQKRCFEVALRVLDDQEWLGGMYWWKYLADPCNGSDVRYRNRERSFIFQDKPAASALRDAYRANDPGS